MSGIVVFQKTSKGVEEIEKRTHGLTPRVRRILIVVDGKRTVDGLRELTAADDLTHTLGMLEEDGFIEVKALINAVGAQVPAPAGPLPSITTFRDDPAPDDPVRLQMSRAFMSNTIRAFTGGIGMSGFIDRIDKASSLAELRGCYDEWFRVMVESREGRRQAESLRTKLLETL